MSSPHIINKDITSISGPTYLNGQTLVEHVSYSLSDKTYSYGTEDQNLDGSISLWIENEQKNASGTIGYFSRMQTRSGAASMILGNIFSRDMKLMEKALPSTVLATSSSLIAMQPVLDQLSLLYNSATPLVAHVSSLDLSPKTSNFVSDYTRALTLSKEGGYAVVNSSSIHEIQHMALFATILTSLLPTIHTYDGLRIGRETARVINVLDQTTLKNAYVKVLQSQETLGKKADFTERVSRLLTGFNSELGTDYNLFDYYGHKEAESVLVVFGSLESSIGRLAAEQLSSKGKKVGLINVRVYRPFAEQDFLDSLPKSIKKVAILGQVYTSEEAEDEAIHSILYSDVLTALAMSDEWSQRRPVCIDIKYSREVEWYAQKMHAILSQIATLEQDINVDLIDIEEATIAFHGEQFVQWDLDNSSTTSAAGKVTCILAMESNQNINYSTTFDNYSEGGIWHAEIKVSEKVVDASYPVEAADISIVSDIKVLNAYDVVKTVKREGVLVLRHSFTAEDIEKKLPATFKRAVAEKSIKLYFLNRANFGDSVKGEIDESVLIELAFLHLARPNASAVELVEKLSPLNQDVDKDLLKATVENIDQALKIHTVPGEWSEVEVGETALLPAFVAANSFVANTEKETPVPDTETESWQTAAKHLAFKEAYDYKSSLRPDVAEKTWQVKVQANRRLTPISYDRNIFHIEFDISGTGLKYELGESLGVHGYNDSVQVEKFLTWYGCSADDLIQVPSRDDPSIYETRTVFQALEQNIDLFGRPAKKFYEILGPWAKDEKERKWLTSLSLAEGAVDFKRRAEVETVTYADLLEEFSSAHPPIEELVKMIPPTKRREYSISSSQKVHPTSVHLLVVVVDWKDQKDRERFGQCTRYLSNLEIGERVTVSLKPSVMKLPPKPSQPIIMAGLGTGLAPFRAFVEERAWQKAQGEEIGAVMLYLGSRHQREEYLYGEEWEAYRDAGVITLLGQAFSRDQPKKVYIQDVMRSTLPDIQKALLGEEGSFYLCGPTWPVPDVQEVLEEAIRSQAEVDGKKIESPKVIEELKDTGRYVLEVY